MRRWLSRDRLTSAAVLTAGLLIGWGLIFGPTRAAIDAWEPPAYAQGFSFTNSYAYWVPPGNCNTTVSGNSTGTQGLTTDGASTTPVVQAKTSATGTNTHTYICNITPPYFVVTTNNGFAIQDAVFFYGTLNLLGTQAATLASGTMNSSTVFASITYPTAATGETASTVTPVRADSGTMVITPVVASANVTTTTAGSYYSVKFAPATPIAWKTDLKQLLLTVTLQATALTPTTTTSPGVLVHFKSQ